MEMFERQSQTSVVLSIATNTTREKATSSEQIEYSQPERVVFARPVYTPACVIAERKERSCAIIQRHARGWLARKYVRKLRLDRMLDVEARRRYKQGKLLEFPLAGRLALSCQELVEIEDAQKSNLKEILYSLRDYGCENTDSRVNLLRRVNGIVRVIGIDSPLITGLVAREEHMLCANRPVEMISGIRRRIYFHLRRALSDRV